jgi:hypothetical protein
MTVQDYLIDHTNFDWPKLLVGWTWLLPPQFTVWLVNRFGDLFLILPDGSIHLLDVGAGTLTKLADSQDEFFSKIDEGQNAITWLMIPLIDELVAAGIQLQPGQCYSYQNLPVVDGKPTPDNTQVSGIVEHYRRCGATHKGIRQGLKVFESADVDRDVIQ